jgi:hypothetical protein
MISVSTELHFCNNVGFLKELTYLHAPLASVDREKNYGAGNRAPRETRSVSSRDQPKLACRYQKALEFALKGLCYALHLMNEAFEAFAWFSHGGIFRKQL